MPNDLEEKATLGSILEDVIELDDTECLRIGVAARALHSPDKWLATLPTDVRKHLLTDPCILDPETSIRQQAHAWVMLLNAEQLGSVEERAFYEACGFDVSTFDALFLELANLERLDEHDKEDVLEYTSSLFPTAKENMTASGEDAPKILSEWIERLERTPHRVMEDACMRRSLGMLGPITDLKRSIQKRISSLAKEITIDDGDLEHERAGTTRSLARIDALEEKLMNELHRSFEVEVIDLVKKKPTIDEIAVYVSAWFQSTARERVRDGLANAVKESIAHESPAVKEALAALPEPEVIWEDVTTADLPEDASNSNTLDTQTLLRALAASAIGLFIPLPFPAPLRAVTGAAIVLAERRWRSSREISNALDASAIVTAISPLLSSALNKTIRSFRSLMEDALEAKLTERARERNEMKARDKEISDLESCYRELNLTQLMIEDFYSPSQTTEEA